MYEVKTMNIAVYCGSSFGTNPEFIKSAEAVGSWIGKNGHTLVYGGSKSGLMGVVADRAIKNGARAVGVLPDIDFIKAGEHGGLDEVIYTKDMAERKSVMLNRSDAFIALPGGPGTLDEISDIFALNRVGALNSPAILVNTDGFYTSLWNLLKAMEENGFTREGNLDKILLSDDIDEIGSFIDKNV